MKNKRSAWFGIKKSIGEIRFTYDIAKLIQLSIFLAFTLVFLDYYDVPSQIIANIPEKMLWVGLGAIVLMVFVWIVDIHVIDLLLLTATNLIDGSALVVAITGALYIPVRVFILGKCCYTRIAFAIVTAAVIILIFRCILRWYNISTAIQKRSNLIDMKDLYENKFTRIQDNPILISEHDVDYDLLDREGIANHLYRSITHCQSDQSFVISLEGEWGSGKTTIINNTKRLLEETTENEKKIIVIDDFDPWLYGTQEALLLAMYETLMKHAGLGYSPLRSNSMVKGISKIVSESHVAGSILYNLIHNEKKSGDEVSILKERINAYLLSSNRTIVFFIDNLDRANEENIIFLFKLISIVFDLPGVVYVLSFERERIDSILKNTHEIDPRFTEKIIQQEIRVPPISEEKTHGVYTMCMHNLLKAYGIPETEIAGFEKVIKYIIEHTKNVRMFKRMINSVFTTVFSEDTLLNKSDLLAIEAIQFFNPELYSLIHKNPKYFVSHGLNPWSEFMWGLNKKEFNKEGAAFFKSVFEKYQDSTELLESMFPYAERYSHKNDLRPEYVSQDSRANEIAKGSRICSGKYFDLYFSHTTNAYLGVRGSVEEYISKMNHAGSIGEAAAITQKTIHTVASENQKEWFEQLQLHMMDIVSEKAYFVAKSIYMCLADISGMGGFLSLAPRARAEYIISDLLTRCGDEEYSAFVAELEGDYKRLGSIDSLAHWLEKDNTGNESVRKARWQKMHDQYSAMCEKILSEGINIYDDQYYLHTENAWSLYRYCKALEKISIFTAYIASILSPQSMYRVLWDITNCIMGSNYLYSIEDKNFNIFIADSAALDKLIAENVPRNEDEEFVRRVYDCFRNGEADVFGHKGVVSAIEVKLEL